MLGGDRYRWRDLSEFLKVTPIEETGSTFLENASLKASSYAKQFNMWSLADDSGLAVDALDGKPGVYSARWAEMNGSGKGDAANNATLLSQIAHVPEDRRTARFICVLALSNPAGEIILTATDSLEGRIIPESRGNNGFGYDPLFLVESLGRTTAELSADEKHAISHRGKALRRLREPMGRVGL